ncbi:hypothetical protein [Flavobacterium sp. 5]|uniref:hypothetical protein n=1 Tax=Flavobacterium sp. 5 TaxID=2035199 RepID=UPI000C2C9A06|nr:hypothetical protein [Flavobacterium sp. 5]PKB18373.1 hypothetical protein CLU82_3648 [Flavobacterium sp. 5]
MIVLQSQGLNGYDDGLNGGLKIAKFIKTNVKSIGKDVSIKNAINVAKVVAPIALSVIPVVGGVAGGIVGKVLNKLTTNADGSANLVGRTVENIQEISKTDVGKSVISFAKPLVKSASAGLLQQKGEIPNDAQLEALATAKGTTAQQELDAYLAANPPKTPVAKTDYTLPIVGGVAVLGIGYMIFK